MKSRSIWWWPAAVALTLAACGHSPPTRYFSLDAVPPRAPLETTGAIASPQAAKVQLGAVRVPASLDRPEVVAQDATHRLSVRDGDHWGAPLAQMMRRTLAQDLLERLPAGTFVLPDAPAPEGTRGIVVTVLDLRANTEPSNASGAADASIASTAWNSRKGQLILEGSWTLTSGQPAKALRTENVALSEPMSSADSGAIADAMSRILARLADDIAASLASQR